MSFYVFDDKKSGFAWICVDLHGFAFRIHPFQCISIANEKHSRKETTKEAIFLQKII